MSVDLSPDQQSLQERAQGFAMERIRPVAMEYVDAYEYPWDLYEAAAREGLVGVWFDEAYGGQGMGLVEQCLVDEAFARGDSNVGLALHSAIVGCYVVSAFGSHEQKKRWLEPPTRGECTTSIGMTEPETGSSLAGISTTAEREGDEYVLSGRKKWIGNGSKSEWVATLCRTDPDTDGTHEGLSLVVVPSDTPGFSAEPLDKLGLGANDHALVEYDDVRVPVENLLGDEEGRGFQQVLAWLNHGHGRIAVAAIAVGQAQCALDRAKAYAEERTQGGTPINEYQGMRWKFADMQTNVAVARSQVYRAARVVDALDRGDAVVENPIEEASIAKLFATEMAEEVAREAVQVFGGNGFETGQGIEHVYRDVKAGTLYEGTSEILRDTIGKTVFGEL